MKFILCGVFLAHSAVVYTVCSAPIVTLWGNGRSITAAFSVPEQTAQSLSNHKNTKKISVEKSNVGSGLDGQNKSLSGNAQDGWQVIGDIHIDTTETLVIRMTVQADGHVESWSVTPTLSFNRHQTLSQQIDQLQFIWRASPPAPAFTIFEKRLQVDR